MATEARVRSVEAIGAFRANVIVFITKARRAVDQVGEEVARTRQWVQNDQRMFWSEQLRKRTRLMEQAQQEYFSAKLSTLKDSLTMQEQALRKAKRAVDEATEKMNKVRMWTRDFDRYADPLVKRLETFRSFLDHTMPKAVHYLEQVERILTSYTDTAVPVDSPPPSSAESPATPENQS